MKKITLMLFLALLLLALLFSFSDQFTSRRIICTDKAPKPIGPYSQAVFVGNTLYVAGQVGFDTAGRLDSTSIEAECMQAMNNVKAIVEAAGLSMSHVVRSTVYVKDLKNFGKINEVYGGFFTKDPPARETVQVAALPKGAHIEISVVAVK